ncbi:MAG: ERCC4 domain-containing protein, partial [Candidatus Micrarchaeota archaeon]
MAIEDFPFREGKAVVLVDDRELKGAASRRLFELGAVLEPQRLPVGDFICSPRLCIERKTAADFESSVIDGRLFTQAAELSSSFTAAIVAVVGRNFERISPQACRGALLSLVADYRIPVLFFDSEGELAEFIFAAASREQLA